MSRHQLANGSVYSYLDDILIAEDMAYVDKIREKQIT